MASVLSCWAMAARAQTPAGITVSAQVVGRTPSQFGYNVGHLYPGSNTASWWAYSGVNAARMWSSPSYIEPSSQDDLAPWGDGVVDLATFNARRAALRADPLNPAFVNWSFFVNNYANKRVTGNNMYLGYALRTLTDLGIRFVISMPRSESSYPWRDPATPEGWADRWEHWQHHYAQAFYLARYYDIHRFQMFNEPDHSSHPNLSQTQFLQQLQFSSDAFQAAVEDVNRLFGKSLVPEVQAPVTAGGKGKFFARPGGDPRDDAIGWGQLVIRNRHLDYAGNLVPSFRLIQTYAAQVYNLTGPAFGAEWAAIREAIAAESGGESIKMAFTEFNAHNAANFETMPETLDSPSKLTRLGSIFANLANNRAEELYVFKFSQTSYDTPSGVKKNGVHYVSNDVAPYNVGGVTRAGEVVRLFARAFVAEKPLLQPPAVSGGGGNLRLAACRDEDAGRYYLFCVNTGGAELDLSIHLAAWQIPSGAKVTVEEVSARFRGEVVGLLDVPQDRVIRFRQRPASVLLFSISAAPVEEVTRVAVADATVEAGSNAGANYGSEAELRVRSHSADPDARAATLLRFDLDGIAPASIRQAILAIHGWNPAGQATVTAHVYGLNHNAWQETAVTWNSAPNLGDARGHQGAGVIERIADNYVEGIGETAAIVGHLSADSVATDLMLDVTPFVREAGDRYQSFLIVREVRFDGDVDDVNSIRFASREAGELPPPRLLLRLPGKAPIRADFDRDADVDMDDFGYLQACLTRKLDPIPPDCLDGDLTGDGFNTAEDVEVFRSCLNGAAVSPAEACPEP